MIRFACPGCQASFTVGDEKGGKTGKCPKCGTAFSIPMPDPASAPKPPPPPPVDPNAPVEIAPCPKCGLALTVEPQHLGAEVECPTCHTIFAAVDKNAPVSKPKPKAPPPPVVEAEDDDEDDRPSRRGKRRDDDEDDDDRPVRKSKRRDDDEDDDDRPVKKSKRRNDDEDEGEDDGRPRKKKKKRKYKEESKRITAVLLAIFTGSLGIHKFYLGHNTAGIVYLLTCGLCGIGPWIDFIIYLTKSDDEFIEVYQRGGKEWF